MRRWAGLAAAVAVLALAPAVASAGTLDQQQTRADLPREIRGPVAAPFSWAQTFTAGRSGQLDQVDLFLDKLGSPAGPLTVEIRDVDGGEPGTTVLTSEGVPPADVPTAAEFVEIPFGSPAPVTAGEQYAIVAYAGGLDTYRWWSVGSPPTAWSCFPGPGAPRSRPTSSPRSSARSSG